MSAACSRGHGKGDVADTEIRRIPLYFATHCYLVSAFIYSCTFVDVLVSDGSLLKITEGFVGATTCC